MIPLREVTQLLVQCGRSDADAMADLIPLVYRELHNLARHHLGRERSDHTLQPTALVHEAYFRLAGQKHVQWRNRAHFFGIASQAMRRILVDYARSRSAAKRGGPVPTVSLDDVALSDERARELIDLDGALSALAVVDPRQSRIVELRFFGGLTIEEIAGSIGVSPATVKRDLNVAKAWLHREMRNTRS